MQQVKWFERTFSFPQDQNIFPSLIERLAGTPLRLEDKCRRIPLEVLTKRVGDTWTIQENVGHLSDLEPLWQGRLEDILAGKKELRPTDLKNTPTWQAHHNDTPIEVLLERFRQLRQQTLIKLQALNEAQVFQSALHPRLKTPMRTLDLFLFVAEHDDHHLARITELGKLISQATPAS
jgi:uncharacterized damage-inducible protein DinB